MSQPVTDPKATDDKATDKTTATDDTTKPNADDDKKATDKPGEDVTGLKKALAAERKEKEGLLKAQRDAELAKLPELERAKSQVIELIAENDRLKIENMRREIAMELELPWSIAKRLTGETEAEMRDDGAELLKSYKVPEKKLQLDDPKNKRPTNDAKKQGTAGNGGMNAALRALAGRR